MAIKLSDSIRVGQQKPLEDKYFNELVPYTSTSQVNTLLLKSVRHRGLTVNINGDEYWYKDGIEDENLVFKSNHKTIEVTREELYNNLIPNEKLEPGRLYKITGIESWSFSQHLINCIYLKALTNTSLETTGFGEFYNVEYGYAPVWEGNLLEAGLIDSLKYGVDDHVIWGNLSWKNISGAVGTNLKYFGEDWGDISLPNYLSDSDWLLLTPQESNHYDLSIDIIKYDIENNYISYREDTLGNKYEQSFNNLVINYPNYEIVDFDESYRYYVGGISLFHWGEPDTVYGNTIKNSLVLNCNNSSNSLTNSFYNNTFENSFFLDNLVISSSIRNNKVLNSYFFYNHLKGSVIEFNEYINSSFTVNRFDTVVFDNNKLLSQSNFGSNIFKDISVGFNTLNNSYITNNNLKNPNQSSNVRLYKNTLYDSGIYNNQYYIDITFNTLSRGSTIAGNIDNEITVYNRISTITKNNLDNACTISNNTFIEEGTGISGYSKGINDNIMTTYCNINNNTIKNGSRIFGHTMDYYSTINGNTLDTDSNIYNNKVIQNGKIDNNILTGHGRIYGNQLDRSSEITLCKLRISPATSYSTTMKSNRLFAGKIQNIDFGDIVNPVGSNPNDPAFGGNDLSDSIIENGSIIKDLTFPNHGGVGIQFVKMNGYSEFKNITVNNPIRNVDFINTIFNETSDYSKLIEGSGRQTSGFTKTYIDGVLLQDRFDEKQDVLTEDNVGQFMDLELATKLTPTSGDTVLGRDSVTGKAVEIPTNQLGGNVDTSTLVPYDNAIKDVNIASNYFKTSKGFDFTKDVNNYFRTYNNGNSTIYDFKSKDESEDNFGSIELTVTPETGFELIKKDNNGLALNSFQINNLETYTLKPFVSDSGFKKTGGTANQALTANGGVFDLNTKADLVGGKIPSSQLPSYVDDVLEFANLASFPATGESGKIYIAIDTNLTYRWGGSSYVVMSSSLALGETASTAYRGDRGKLAYDHSQTTGNPHNTKLEELTDVSGDNTSIIDTDVILKKDTGGLWKKITFANFKNWFTTELAKKINIGLDTVFNFKNISAMTLTEFRGITPNLETIYFTEEQNATGWQQVRYNSNLSIGYQALTESVITINSEAFLELDSDSSFNLIDVENTKIKGIFENDFMIITFSSKVDTPSTPNQWFKLILKVNGVQVAVSPVFYLLEPAGMPERISHSFALNVTPEMITHGITLHIKPSVMLILNSHSLTVTRVHKSTNANL